MKPTLLILAAGMGSRYGGLKQMDKIGPSGETIIDYSIYDAIEAGFGKIVFVIRESFMDDFKAIFNPKLEGKIAVEYVTQEITKVPKDIAVNPDREKPWGTGHAILMAKDVIKEPFAVINADDFYGREAFVTIAEFLSNKASATENCMVGYDLQNTISENGSVSRGVCEMDNERNLKSIVERTQIEKQGENIAFKADEKWQTLPPDATVSMNFWGFTPELFGHLENQFADFLKERGCELKSEFYIPTVVANLMGEVNFKVLQSDAQWFGVTYREDREKVVDALCQLAKQGTYPKDMWTK